MSVWRERDYLVEPGTDRVALLDALAGLQEHPGYAWLERVIRKRMDVIASKMISRITASSQTTKDSKVDLHNTHVTEHETLRDVLQLVQDALCVIRDERNDGRTR